MVVIFKFRVANGMANAAYQTKTVKSFGINEDTAGLISGEFPGIVTVDGSPSSRHLILNDRLTGRPVRDLKSDDNGTYLFDYLDSTREYDLIARDHKRVYKDIIIPAIRPYVTFPRVSPKNHYFIEEPSELRFKITGGSPPYTIEDFNEPTGVTVNIEEDEVVFDLNLSGDVWIDFGLVDSKGNKKYYQFSVKGTSDVMYWRIYITENNGATNHTSLVELEMYEDLSGPNLCTGGFGITSPEYTTGSWGVARAFDGIKDQDVGWATRATVPTPAWVGYKFPSSVNINHIKITSRGTSLTQPPKNFVIQKSEDGVNWIDQWAVTDQTDWTAYQERTFSRP